MLVVLAVMAQGCPTFEAVLNEPCAVEGLICEYVLPTAADQEVTSCDCGAADPDCPCFVCSNGVYTKLEASLA
ncbi:hypothetical protein IV203_025069 [Nitzschia inconspicua]|uniref:Uncharacterized protein n=1 Tax=Nitzschia inconspicua TaxID=303405 RepID=A0A9K3LPL2_9STRA|nr:hypothetical protein IV203_025182 [Nitzschia inconspicua]KAG7365628.1 hypothetical protein IV203_025069 [Nitzschia inconspicua]